MHFAQAMNRRIDVLYSQASDMGRLMTILTAFLFLSVLVVPQGVSDETTNDDTSTAYHCHLRSPCIPKWDEKQRDMF